MPRARPHLATALSLDRRQAVRLFDPVTAVSDYPFGKFELTRAPWLRFDHFRPLVTSLVWGIGKSAIIAPRGAAITGAACVDAQSR